MPSNEANVQNIAMKELRKREKVKAEVQGGGTAPIRILQTGMGISPNERRIQMRESVFGFRFRRGGP